MRMLSVGQLIEDHRDEVTAAWKRSVEHELRGEPAALSFAVAPLLRELSLALRADPAELCGTSAEAPWSRCVVLVRSLAQPAELARETKLLRRALWEVLRLHGHPVAQQERRIVDEWLDDALVAMLERQERVRLRVAPARGPMVVPAVPQRAEVEAPEELGRVQGAGRQAPPPLPKRAAVLHMVADEDVVEVVPAGGDELKHAALH